MNLTSPRSAVALPAVAVVLINATCCERIAGLGEEPQLRDEPNVEAAGGSQLQGTGGLAVSQGGTSAGTLGLPSAAGLSESLGGSTLGSTATSSQSSAGGGPGAVSSGGTGATSAPPSAGSGGAEPGGGGSDGSSTGGSSVDNHAKGGSAGQAGASSSAGQAGASSSAGQAGASSSAGQAGVSSSAGRAGVGSSAGQAGAGSSAGQAGAGSSAGQAGAGSSAGQAGAGSSAGQAGAGGSNEVVCTIQIPAALHNCSEPLQVVALGNGTGKLRINLMRHQALEITLEVENPKGYVLDVGDSECNDGGGGDCGATSYDAEIDVVERSPGEFPLVAFPNDLSAGSSATTPQFLHVPSFCSATGTTTRRLTILDRAVRLDDGTYWESDALLRVTPPSSLEGSSDTYWYVGLNRVVSDSRTDRVGSGVRTATLRLR